MIRSLEPILREHPFFAGLPHEWIQLVSGCARNARFRPGEILVHEGEPADFLFLFRSGHAAVQVQGGGRGAVAIETVHEGDLLGWSWLVPPYRYRFTAQAMTEVRAFAIDGRCLRAKCDERPDLGYAVLQRVCAILSERLATARMQLLDLYGAPHA